MTDPFGTAQIRERVLTGWAAAPVRLREDANAEEDLALGGYRDRLVVELAQNAADAAIRRGTPGRLALTLREQAEGPPVLVAANTGEPLTASGVQSLATLRASAKTDQGASVGRFGVGFAATLAVSDEPMVLSRPGGVRFSRDDTAALVAEAAVAVPALADEVRRRGGHVPVLRLPFAVQGAVPEGFDTAVVLPLRDEVAADVVREQLAALDDALLLSLPALAEVLVDLDGRVRTLSGAERRWHVLRDEGSWTGRDRAELLTDRPTEERRQAGWQVLWALPRDPGTTIPPTVHAPTATDEPSSLPALLLATFPLDPSRRHVQPGPLADRIAREAATAYVELVRRRAQAGDDVLPLVPVGLAAGVVDGAVRAHVLDLLPGVPLLRSAEDAGLSRPRDAGLLRPRDAVVLDGAGAGADDPAVLAALAPMVAGLVAAPRRDRAALAALRVGHITLSDVVDALSARGEPADWRELYAGLAPLADDGNAREALASLRVPLVDGRVVRGVRGLLMPAAGLAVDALQPLQQFGLRLVHPDAAHPLLMRLGAVPASARSLLDDGAVRAAVLAGPDADDAIGAIDADAADVATAVLALVDRARSDGALEPGALPWLGDLALPDAGGELSPAASLALPGSVAAALLDADEIGLLEDGFVRSWPVPTLTAVGVLDGLGVVRASDVDLADPPDELADLDGFDQWADELGGGTVGEVVAVRDLDVVRDDRWPELLRHLATDPAGRAALTHGVKVVTGSGVVASAPSYSAWWLRRELRLTGTALVTEGSPLPGLPGLRGLLDAAPGWVVDLDAEVRQLLGVVGDLGRQPPSPQVAATLLSRMAEDERQVDVPTCCAVWRFVAQLVGDLPPELAAPERVRVLTSGDRTGVDRTGVDRTGVVDTDDAYVADDPRWLQRTDLGGLVVAPQGLAARLGDLLDVALGSELAEGVVDSPGVEAVVPDAVRALLPAAPGTWQEHDALTVDGYEVDWWVDDAGLDDGGPLHASTTDGLARALAFSQGEWARRELVAAVLADPADVIRIAVEAAAE